MIRNSSLDSLSAESDVFYEERSSEEKSPVRNSTATVLNFTQIAGALATEAITISSVASPEPRIVMKESDSNEPTIPYGLGRQHPILPQ